MFFLGALFARSVVRRRSIVGRSTASSCAPRCAGVDDRAQGAPRPRLPLASAATSAHRTGPTVTERTLVLVKPDAVRRGLVGEVLGRFERKGLAIVALDLRTLDGATAEQHYAEHVEQAVLRRRCATSSPRGPLVALVLEGDEAIEVVRAADRAPPTPQGRRRARSAATSSLSNRENLVHGSDSAGVRRPRDRDLLPRPVTWPLVRRRSAVP